MLNQQYCLNFLFIYILMFRVVKNLLAFSTQSFNNSKNYYKILNVDELATAQVIKTSYKTLAKKYHPDVNKGKQEQFKEVNEAYQVISDPTTKRQYDQARSYQTHTQNNNHYSSSSYNSYDPKQYARDPWKNQNSHQHQNQYYYNPYQRQESAKMHSWTSADQQLYEYYRKQQADYMNRYYQTQRQRFQKGYRSPVEEEYMRRFMEEVARRQHAQDLKEQRQSQAQMQEERLQRQYDQSKKKIKQATRQMAQEIGNIAKGLWNAYLELKKKK